MLHAAVAPCLIRGYDLGLLTGQIFEVAPSQQVKGRVQPLTVTLESRRLASAVQDFLIEEASQALIGLSNIREVTHRP